MGSQRARHDLVTEQQQTDKTALEVEVGAESEKYPKFHMRESSFCVNLGKKKKKQLSGTLMEQQQKKCL